MARTSRTRARGANGTDQAQPERINLYDEVTAKIIAQLEEGRVPWVQPWASSAGAGLGGLAPGLPRNALTARKYSGVNILILWGAAIERDFPSQSWLTFKQARDAGGCVRKGEQGTTVVYADRFTPEAEKEKARTTGEDAKTIAFLKRFTVFNVSQCEGLRPDLAVDPAPLPEREIVVQAEELIVASGVDFRVGGHRAFYVPSADFVQVPPQPAFFEQINFYRTCLHELTHATGHASRLDRTLTNSFGSKDYAREELIVRRVGANKGVKTCLLDSWENPCVPDLPVLVMNRLKSRNGNGTIACREKAQTAETIVGRAGHRKVRTAKATLPELQSSGFYPRQRRSDGCSVAPCRNRIATRSDMKRVVRSNTLGPASAACPSSMGSKGRTERLTASHLLVRVNTGSPKWARQRPTWRQSRHSSQMPGVMPRTAIGGWTITDERCRATGAGLLTGRVKGGSACETGSVNRVGVLMLPDTLQRRLESIPTLSRQGKRINGLSRMMADPLLWEQAYAEIASNRGALTPGVTGETLDGFSLERVERIIGQITNGSYRFAPVRRVLIPKANGKTRPLGIPTASDKLVQAAVKLLLERIYEPVFSPRSHGFRRGRSCHTALEHIKDTWTGVKWLVDVDVVGFFDNIDHGILIDLLERKIDDKRFIRLIEGMLKAGYMEDWSFNATYSGTPQGGVVSPILANIYLHELDQFLTEMKARFDRGERRAENPRYRNLTIGMYKRRLRVERLLSEGREAEAQTVLAKIREMETERSTMPSKNGLDPNFKRLLFCRYADDFIIGVIGSKADAREVMAQVTDYLRHHLRLEASPEKSKVSKASKGTMFLGYTVITVTGSRVRRTKLGRRVVRSRDCADRIHLRVPHDRLVRFNQRKGYGDLGRLKAMHRRYLVDSSMLEIVLAYNAEMRGLANYYRLAYVAKFSLRKLWFLWETSLLKTLAFKLRLSVNQVAHRLKTRDGLAVRFKVDGKERSVAVFNLKHIDRLPNLGPNVDRWAVPHFTKGRSDVMDRLRAKQCEYCGSTDNPCEVHHSRRLADVKDTPLWKQVAAARRRKRVVLCLPCHKALHAGQLKPLDSGDMQARRAG